MHVLHLTWKKRIFKKEGGKYKADLKGSEHCEQHFDRPHQLAGFCYQWALLIFHISSSAMV